LMAGRKCAIAATCAICHIGAMAQAPPAFLLAPAEPAGRAATAVPARRPLGAAAAGGAPRSAAPWQGLRAMAALAGASAAALGRRRRATAMRGLKDRVKKDFSTKSAMIRKLGKLVLQKEFDMRTQIMEDPKLAARSGCTQEQLLADFERAVVFLREELGCKPLEADICISKVATGLHMQYLGRPCIPSNEEMLTVLGWLTSNLKVSREDGTLRVIVEKYPFVLGRTVEELNESRRFCPPDINYDTAVAEDPALVDKTYNCDGICANMCTACWYNG